MHPADIHLILSSYYHASRDHKCLAVSDVLHRALLVNVNVEAVGLVVHGAHRVGLKDAVLLG